MEDLEFLWKDLNSGGNGCHTLIKSKRRGGYYTIGSTVTDPTERAEVLAIAEANNSGLGPGEELFFVVDNVLDRLR